ncbi:MAG: 50S ribosomal protein L9 [Alphaproteobacteria bacterium]|nr:50S ribosomal protein L9 [Alphaproteobacteria bacterium]
MEVILLERIEKLGQLGQVVKVRPGFARNFLLPQKKALRATKSNLELFEKQRADLEAKNAEMRAAAQAEASKIDNIKVVIIRQASETGQLFGSVSARDVADAAKAAGHVIERQQVQIDAPIKALGLFPVKIKLHPEVLTKITVNIARSPEEAVIQQEKGVAIIKAAEKQAEVDAAKTALDAMTGEAKPEEPADADGAKKTKAKGKAKAAKAEKTEAEEPAAPKKAKAARSKKSEA